MPTKAYEVHLEMFEGPLDLLLYLIKKNDLDVTNIPISAITQEYIAYLDLMKELNLDVAGDFLVMASTLIQIKARSLLPASGEVEGVEGPDPQGELVAKLLEYQKFKEAANFLQKRADDFSGVFYRGAPRFEEHEKALNIRIFDLLSTLREVLDRAEDDGRVVLGEEYPIEDKIKKILDMLEEKPYVRLRDIFRGEKRRLAIITCFMAMLELIKTQRVFARQESAFADIMIYKKDTTLEVSELGGMPVQAKPLWPGDDEPAGEAEVGPVAQQDTAEIPEPETPEEPAEIHEPSSGENGQV